MRLTPRPQWGVGRVLETDGDGKAIVFFEMVGAKRLVVERAKLEDVEESDVAPNSVLMHLREDCLTGPPRQQPRSLSDLVKAFNKARPDGFVGAKFTPKQRGYVEKAKGVREDTLSADRLRTLIETGAFGEAHDVIRKAVSDSGLVTTTESNRIKAIPPEQHEAFARAVLEMVHGDAPVPERIQGMVDAVGAAATWPNLGVFMVLAAPGELHLVRGDLIGKCAEVLGYQIDSQDGPNANMYEKLSGFTAFVKSAIEAHDLAPRDLIDVEIFLAEATGFNDKPVRRKKTSVRKRP